MLSLSFFQFPFTVHVALLLFFTGTRLDARQVFVDDADTTKITYSPGWNVGNNCTNCFAQPDGTQASGGTWHDGTVSGTAGLFFNFTFTGTSVEARYIGVDTTVPEYVSTAGTNVSYSVDGVQLGTFVRNPANRNSYVYDQSLFNITALTNRKHTLRVDLLPPSVLLLDYIIYDDGTMVTNPPETSLVGSTLSSLSSPANNTSSSYDQITTSGPSQNLGSIIGGVVGAVFALVLGAVLVWYYLKRRGSAKPAFRTNDLSRPQSLLPSEQPELRVFTEATMHGPLSSHFGGPSDTTNQGFYKYPQTSLTATPPHSTNHTETNTSAAMGSNLSGESLTGMNVMGAASTSLLFPTIASNLSTTAHFSSMPSTSEAHQNSRAGDRSPVGLPPYSLQDLTTGGAPSGSHRTDVPTSLVPAQIPDEPVEEGLMSSRASMVTTLPPYSPRGFLHDEHAPPLP